MNCLILLILLFCCGNNSDTGCGNNSGWGNNSGCGNIFGGGNNSGCGNILGGGNNFGGRNNTCGCSSVPQERNQGSGGRNVRAEQRGDGRQMMNESYVDDSRRDRGFNSFPSQGSTCGCED
ncbi:MAG: hypothetical protein GX235_05660 [Clostridiales bacterium]|nr:hypothetical protein [Clostridiales bacterium]